MGASESKLVFKQGIFKLQDPKPISADDTYWTGFWELPESTEDVFTLFSANDIRRTRDASLTNLETLILAVTSRLFALRQHSSFPNSETAPEKDALNCIRVLTRILPFIYEADNLEGWEEKFFWGARRKRVRDGALNASEVIFDEANPDGAKKDGEEQEGAFEDAKPLAEELIDTLIDLLFYSGFTIPVNEKTKSKINYSIWTSGVGCNATVPSNNRLENNRTEALRLLLTLASKSMYMPASVLPTKGVKAITYIATCPDKQVVLSTLCSLLNTAIKFNPASWRIPYDHVVVGDPKHLYVASSLQFLLVLLLYPVPEDGKGSSKNFFRHFLGRLHRPQDFQFICDGMSRTLHQPLTATTTYLPGSHKPVRWAPEMIMLFWETIQCNKRFRSFIVDTERGHDFVILVLYYAIENRLEPSKQGIVRMCVFVLQTLSVEENFGAQLNDTFKNQETLPAAIRIDSWMGSYGDFLIVSVHTLLTGSKGKLDAVYPALLAIINNVGPYLENLNALSCLKLMQLLASMSSPSFLLANETNHALLMSLLEAMNSIVEHKYKENPRFILAIVKSRRRFEALRSFTLESGQEEIEKLKQRQKEAIENNADGSRSPPQSARGDSLDALRSPASTMTPTLSNVPEEGGAFAIGDEEDSDMEDEQSTEPPSNSSTANQHSRTSSVSSSIDSSVPTQLRGMSEKARGKMPVGTPTFSRVNSVSSVTSYSAIQTPTVFTPSPQWIESWLPSLPLHTILTLLSSCPDNKPPEEQPAMIEPTAPRVHSFEWSPLSLGWYESLLWSFICTSEMIVERGTVGVWNGTGIRLFKVEKEVNRGPSLMKPMGAVDAVGKGIVQRIGSLNLRGGSEPSTPRERQNGGATVRDV